MIPQIKPVYYDGERAAVQDYLSSDRWLTEHEFTHKLEAAIAEYVGIEHAFLVPNCTLALYAVYACLGIGPGDEVIVPAYTMIATANAVKMAGAEPVFVDVNDAGCLDLRRVEERITPRTRAVVVVDINGRSPDMGAAIMLAEAHGLHLIEDAAQALGSEWRGKHLGTFGVAGCYSFSPHKIITMGQGGCLVTDDDDLALTIKRFKNFGRDGSGGRHDYDHFGINLKFTDLQAAFGLAQLETLADRQHVKRILYNSYYRRLFKWMTPIESYTVPWYVDIFTRRRDELAAYLRERQIETQIVYPPVPKTAYYIRDGRYPVAERISREGLWLPSSVDLTLEEVDTICYHIQRFFEGEK